MFDFDRGKRTGLDEVVLSEGKSTAQLIDVFREVTGQTSSILFTRLTADRFGQLPADVRAALDYDPVSRTAMCGGHPRRSRLRSSGLLRDGRRTGFVSRD